MINLLVVTSDITFGELIRQNLEEMGRFTVRVAGEKKSAVSCVKEDQCPLVFLDTCLAGKDLLEIGIQIRRVNPKARFVVISEAGWHSTLEELSPEDYLSKPFYLPDLLDMMGTLFPDPDSSQTELEPTEAGSEPPWLSDVTRAAQHLTRLTLGSSAQAALITRNDQLWAYAGQLPQSATRELTETVLRYWDRQQENDLVRFVRLASTDAEHMLYATRLTQNMVLALIFDAETPFGTIRTQASQLVHSLSTSPVEKQTPADQTEDDAPSAPISAILNDIPSPNPEKGLKAASFESLTEFKPANPFSSATLPRFNRESSPAFPANRLDLSRQDDPPIDDAGTTEIDLEQPSGSDLGKTIESSETTRKNKANKYEPDQDDLGATRPNLPYEPARKIILEPVSPSYYNLDYTCLLIPRFTQHHLIGDLSECLSGWIYNACIAYGWKLESLSVRPEYLLWTISVPPATSPGYVMRILRQNTSEKIFPEFPRFKKENPSGDFWAPGYLIMGGSQPPPPQLIKDFIAQTRQRQGISPQFR